MSERIFRPSGLGYVMELPRYGTTFTVDRLRRSSGDLHGELIVRSRWPGAHGWQVDDGDPVLHASRMNLASASSRRTVGRAIAERVPARAGEELDWVGFTEEFCIRVMLAERAGVELEWVGDRPPSIVPAWAVSLLVPFRQYGILYGPGGIGKSLIGQAICISVQTGRELVPGFPPEITGPALYLDWERTADEANRRAQLLCSGAGIEPVRIAYRPGKGRTLADQVESVSRQADEIGAVFLLIDSATKAIGTSGEGPIEDAANRFAMALDAIGRSALVIDHVPKPKLGEKRPRGGGPIGSVMKLNWASASWELREARPTDDESDTTHLALFHDKTNTTRKRARPIGLSMTWTHSAIAFEREEITDDELIAELSVADRIALLLERERHPMAPKEIAASLGIEGNKVRSVLSRSKRFVNLGAIGYGLAAEGVS